MEEAWKYSTLRSEVRTMRKVVHYFFFIYLYSFMFLCDCGLAIVLLGRRFLAGCHAVLLVLGWLGLDCGPENSYAFS